jgi:hypothetical protein
LISILTTGVGFTASLFHLGHLMHSTPHKNHTNGYAMPLVLSSEQKVPFAPVQLCPLLWTIMLPYQLNPSIFTITPAIRSDNGCFQLTPTLDTFAPLLVHSLMKGFTLITGLQSEIEGNVS